MAYDYMKHYVVDRRDAYIRWIIRNDERPFYEVFGYFRKDFMLTKHGAFWFQGQIPKEQFDILRVPRNGNHHVEVWIDDEKILG